MLKKWSLTIELPLPKLCDICWVWPTPHTYEVVVFKGMNTRVMREETHKSPNACGRNAALARITWSNDAVVDNEVEYAYSGTWKLYPLEHLFTSLEGTKWVCKSQSKFIYSCEKKVSLFSWVTFWFTVSLSVSSKSFEKPRQLHLPGVLQSPCTKELKKVAFSVSEIQLQSAFAQKFCHFCLSFCLFLYSIHLSFGF